MDDDIICMARAAGCHDNGEEFRFVELRYLAHFAALVRADEREKLRRRLAALHDELLLASVAEVRMKNGR